jgi:hypothetical protein
MGQKIDKRREKMTKFFKKITSKQFIQKIVFALISFIVSYLAGIIIGQIGRLFFAIFGKSSSSHHTIYFIFLFLITFIFSFYVNHFLKKWYQRRSVGA